MDTLPPPKVEIRKLIASGKTPAVTEQTTPEDVIAITDERVRLLWDKVNTPSNNPRMLLLEEKRLLQYHSVYSHHDVDGTVVYVGEGIFGRDDDALARRGHEHSRWMLEQINAKRSYVKIVESELTKAQAKAKQDTLIKLHQPKFNKVGK